MTDIIERLRKPTNDDYKMAKVMWEAADEIERLRALIQLGAAIDYEEAAIAPQTTELLESAKAIYRKLIRAAEARNSTPTAVSQTPER